MSANPTFDQAFSRTISQHRTPENTRLLDPVPAADRIGFGRVLAVEVRKLVNTVTGRVLLAVIGAITLVTAVLTVVLFDTISTGSWVDNVGLIGFGVTLLLPILGVLLSTQEWTQRTALTTFALEPRRNRVLLAKVLVAVGWAVAAFAVVVVLAIATFALGASINNVPVDWSLERTMLLGQLGVLVLNTLMAMGFGMLLMNTPAAIVTYMALPTVMPLLSMIHAGVAKVLAWIDPSQAWAPLMGTPLTVDGATKLVVSVAVLIGLPLVAGIVRQMRREVK